MSGRWRRSLSQALTSVVDPLYLNEPAKSRLSQHFKNDSVRVRIN